MLPRGGARPGAGRKKGGKNALPPLMPLEVKTTTNLDKHTYAQLERDAIYRRKSVALVVRELVERKYRCNCDDCNRVRAMRGEA